MRKIALITLALSGCMVQPDLSGLRVQPSIPPQESAAPEADVPEVYLAQQYVAETKSNDENKPYVVYEPREYTKKTFLEMADKELRSESEKEILVSGIPKGGYLDIQVTDFNINLANPYYYDVIVTVNDEVIKRAKGDREVPGKRGDYWFSKIVVPIDQQITTEFNVRVIKNKDQVFDYTIKP